MRELWRWALAWVFSAFGLSPSKLDFGTLQLGSGGRLPVHLTNRGMTEFHAASITLEGADAQDFEVDPLQSCVTVNPGESCVVWVDFRPRDAGEKHAQLIVRANNGSQFSSEFTGVATVKGSAPPPPPTRVGPPKRVITHFSDPPNPLPPPPISNGGPQPPLDTAPKVAQGGPPANQPVQPPRVVAPPYIETPPPTPSTPTPPRRTPPSPPPPVIQPSPLYAHLTMTPETAQFSAKSADGKFFTSPAQTIIVINDGTAAVQHLTLSNSLSNGPFIYAPKCPTYLARGQQCTVQVSFAPRDARPQTDTLSAFNDGAHLATVTLHGGSTVPQPPPGRPHVSFKPREVQFAISSSDGWVTVTQNVAVVSDGTADVQRLVLSVGPTGAPFAVSGGCPARLVRGQSCMLQVTFDQKSQRVYNGTLTAYDGNIALAALPLRGGGTPADEHPHVTMTPPTLRFSSSMQYNAAYVPARGTVEVRNEGAVDLRALSLRLGPASAPFRYSNCPSGLPRGQSCTVQVYFAAKDAGQYVATLTAYEGGARMADVQLYGMGAKPPQPPVGKVIGTVDGAYPKSSGTPAKVGTGSAPPQGNRTGKGNAPAPTSPSRNETYRLTTPNRVATSAQQLPPVAPAPAMPRNAPAKRAAPKPPPPQLR